MTFDGYQASRDASISTSTVLTNGTAIGKNARVAQSNSIILGGTGADAVNVGIGTTTPGAKLEVNGYALFDSSMNVTGAGGIASTYGVAAATLAVSGASTFSGVITSTAIYVSSATIGTDEYSNGTYVSISTITWANGNIQKVTLTANTAFNFIAPAHPSTLTLRILTGAGSFACTWPGNVKWSGGTGPTITATASKVDFCIFKYASDGNYYGSCTGTQNF